jgi:hypothetical protein
MLLSLRSRFTGSFQIPALLVVFFLSANAAFGQAQSNAADIQGTVKDSTNAVVPNATVTARNPNTNVTRNATTNDEGLYRLRASKKLCWIRLLSPLDRQLRST